ncbi:MAG: hypothetical protein HOM11_00975 [Methylococcales bacterium]|jgi:hypothetical protein|nr:hypothetical protein [Methylococcales bacterium]MBT7444691.1 hypothetical protein [Methylococcales bacterium]
MNTPLPSWVQWLAQDADGQWWGYEHEPNEGDVSWYENEVGRSIRLNAEGANPLWRQALQKVEEH